MTREEAIQVLSQRPMIAPSQSNKQKMFEEATDMAIEALSAEPSKMFKEFYDTEKGETMSDLIKREDAIGCCNCHGSIDCINRINALPSADVPYMFSEAYMKQLRFERDYLLTIVNGQWIPCSERLPEQSNDYICTIPLDEEETFVKVLTFHNGRFYEDDDEWGATIYDDVIAWMPLPKPYKGGDTE